MPDDRRPLAETTYEPRRVIRVHIDPVKELLQGFSCAKLQNQAGCGAGQF